MALVQEHVCSVTLLGRITRMRDIYLQCTLSQNTEHGHRDKRAQPTVVEQAGSTRLQVGGDPDGAARSGMVSQIEFNEWASEYHTRQVGK
jgi:hypothetical protein